ncbi:DUF2867 domain-containing protein [Roseomonas hellenica]|uniref:DUF2867 domain-containing protein n=1 Tax=Plastoroseomonas hellenica TaxID=2687306 RepID=A0ABS5F8I1_9PROT|nr:DUF2867 domain-containing protein [Plastoroseomonas hellenica]MBR0668870.1 DUF2867 domain-containing protein [Plastoroseomonas hellenica]
MRPDIAADTLLTGAQFIDAYGIAIDAPALDARMAAEGMLGSLPGWINGLMAVRNFLVTPFGLKTPVPGRAGTPEVIGVFPVVSESPERLVAGFDDKHLDFRVVVDVAPASGRRRVTATTLVRTHNLLGRVYLAAVLPFHRIIVPSMLRQLLKPRH